MSMLIAYLAFPPLRKAINRFFFKSFPNLFKHLSFQVMIFDSQKSTANIAQKGE